ncbi:MAG: HEAT repeat domain-containing protein, partial [Pirellulales bacterium]|nr:HEAT repeat domain-containing protein [Pirellulales bacterium]
FNDTRFAVRQQAITQCVQRGASMLPSLSSSLARADRRVRLNCVWALTRLAQREEYADAAAAALRIGLQDRDAVIRQAACHGIGRCVAAVDAAQVIRLANDPNAAVRRTAAKTLGKLGDTKSIPALLETLAHPTDRSLQHAITYAMIEIGDAPAIRQAVNGLSNVTSLQRRLALIAIDQIDPKFSRAGEVFAGFDTGNADDRSTALQIVRRHPEWATEAETWVRRRLKSSEPLADGEELGALLTEYASHDSIGELMGRLLGQENPTAGGATAQGATAQGTITWGTIARKAIARGGPIDPHPSWIKPLQKSLQGADPLVLAETIAAVSKLRGDRFLESLKDLANNRTYPIAIRLQALAAITARSASLDDETFELLIGWCEGTDSAIATGRAAEIIGAAKLSDPQLDQVVALLSKATPFQLKSLLPCFARLRNPAAIRAFVEAVGSAEAFFSLAEHELSDVTKRYPAQTLGQVNELLDRLRTRQQHKRQRLESWREQVALGDAERGRMLFRSDKAKCSACHRVGDHGAAVGPDLTSIGANRTVSDLLESIVFPSASIVRDFDSYKVLTLDGRVLTGVLVSENTREYVLQQASGEQLRLDRREIETITPSPVSMMPAGLEAALSESELADVVAYLTSLRGPPPSN